MNHKPILFVLGGAVIFVVTVSAGVSVGTLLVLTLVLAFPAVILVLMIMTMHDIRPVEWSRQPPPGGDPYADWEATGAASGASVNRPERPSAAQPAIPTAVSL
ncbi:MAG: hypothetical protein ACRDXX_11845 [Stackebrandtia sp.]